MTTLTLPSRPTLIGSVLNSNPFYLLSALCMLAGCVALTNSLSFSPIRLPRLLLLILTLNVYEVMLVGLGLFLIVTRNLKRDGTMLLCLEALFMVDAAFLNAEIFAVDVVVGLSVNAALLIVTVLKLVAIFSMLGLRMRSGIFAMIIAQVALLYAIPGVFRHLSERNEGVLSPLVVYAAWWVVALAPIGLSLALRRQDPLEPWNAPLQQHRRLVGLLLVLPMISILVHLGTMNWVYNVRWYAANSVPLLLGLAVAVGMYDRHVTNLAARMRTQLLLPLVAIFAALHTPGALVFHIAGVPMTPLRLTLLAAALVFLHGLILHRHVYFAWAAGFCLALTGIGETPAAIVQNSHHLMRDLTDRATKLVPRTTTHWGLVAVVASFVLLILGALVSLLRPAPVAQKSPIVSETEFQ